MSKVNSVFEARSPLELASRYDDWAASYEQDMDDHGGPREAVDVLTRFVPPGSRILDAGCGTGLAGKLLSDRGYSSLEGLDLSEGMLREAAKKHCYNELHQGILGETLPFPDATFDAVLVIGVFARAHAPSRSLHELIRITKPGGYVIFTLRPEFYVSTDFKATMTELTESEKWTLVETTQPFDGRYKDFPGINLQVWTFRVPFSKEGDPVPKSWNETAMPYPADRCVHHLFEEQAAITPDAVALIHEHRHLSYAELNSLANRLAHYLQALGAGPESLVGICVTRSPRMLVGLLAILKAGAAYVALDPAYPKVRQAFMIEDAAMPILLTERDLVDNLPAANQTRLVCLDSDWDLIEKESDTNPDVAVKPENLAYILYTSGSTGRPKGVAIEHRSVVVFVTWAKSVFAPEELARTLAGTSICFDLSVFEMFVPLACGGAIVLAENAIALPTVPARNEVTLINTVPSAMNALVTVEGVPSSVRVVNLAGEPLPNKLVQDIYGPGIVRKVYNLYGPSEDTTYSTFVLAVKGAVENPTIGRPIANTQVYIVDENMRLTTVGTPGELCLSGDGLARGYLNRPDLTEAKFVPNPFGRGRLYRTGDLARYLPDGNIQFMGRMDYQVKVRGFRIELGEIETALEQCPVVDRAVVLAIPDSRDELQLVAYLTANDNAAETLLHDTAAQDHVSAWTDVYEDVYRQTITATDQDDLTFNTLFWRSSYTGEPIPTVEMQDWLKQTVDGILTLQPRDVLEIGVGTGMLLARIAPHCNSYVGLDISRTALEHIRKMQRNVAGLDRIELFERGADQLDGFASGRFDTVIINSVVQHFPDVDYLLRVLDEAVRLVRPGGYIVVGDALNLPLLETFHTSVELYRSADTDTSAQLKQRIRDQIARESDMLLHPDFFAAFAKDRSGVSHVEVLPKKGRYSNQLNRFRYDAILHVGETVPLNRDLVWLDWQRQKLTLTEMRQKLSESSPAALAFCNIPNARLDREVAAMPWIAESAPDEIVSELRTYLTQQSYKGIEPEDLRELAESSGYQIEISWLNTNPQGVYQAVFTRRDQPRSLSPISPQAPNVFPGPAYANRPQRDKLNRRLIPQVRQFLQDKLPHYMMPAMFTVLEKLPLSQTGKIDRRALAQIPVSFEPLDEPEQSVALKPLEKLLAGAWAEALNLNRVGLNDSFYALGGDSLKAVALVHQLQRKLNQPFLPMVLLEAPTVAQFAAYVEHLHRSNGMEQGEI